MTTGCERCDNNNRPMLTDKGTFYDQADDLHRAVHDMLRSIISGVAPFSKWLNRMLSHDHRR